MRILFAAFLGVVLITTGIVACAVISNSHDGEEMRQARATAFICGADWAFWQPDQRHQFGEKCDDELVNAYVNGGLLDLVREGKFP